MEHINELPVELASLTYESHTQVTEIALRVFGGKSHSERVDAATDALERWTDYLYASESTVVSVGSYECRQQFTISGTGYTDSGIPYVLFTFGNFQETF